MNYVLVSEHKELYETVHHLAGAPGLNCWKHQFPSLYNVVLPQTLLWTDKPSLLTSKADISAAHSARLPLQQLL